MCSRWQMDLIRCSTKVSSGILIETNQLFLSKGVSKSGSHSIGLAQSDDGVNWKRTSNQPVLSCSNDPLAWDSGGVGSPHLVWMPSSRRWRMYYVGYRSSAASGSNPLENNGIGVAESVDEQGTAFQRISIMPSVSGG